MDINLSTQAEVNDFQATYGSGWICNRVTGKLTVSGDGVTDVGGLSNIVSIGILVIKNNNDLTNIDGLSSVSRVEGYASIYGNAVLADIDGLANLTSIAGNLHIGTNNSLLDIIANCWRNGADHVYRRSFLSAIFTPGCL